MYRSLEAGRRARPAGLVRGTIRSVDYASGTLLVSGGPGVIALLPSTAIYVRHGYGALSDLRAGQRVEIAVTAIDGHYIAQSVRVVGR